MAQRLRFDGQVAVVTGAGSGLGRAFAIELAKRGAKVVVNNRVREGQQVRSADTVAAEIANLGGQAVASYDDALNGAAIIKTAIDSFGRVDILVTNMGMIKDQTMLKMTEAGWNDVMQANFQTTVNIIKAAWPYMKKQHYGRIITVNSGSAMFGSFGQVNYASAKGALYGLSKSLGKEGEADNIKVNILIPMAATNMTKAHFPPEHVPTFGPEKVSPLLAILAHEKCPDNCQIFEAGGGMICHIRWQRTRGCFFGDNFTPEDVSRHWSEIVSFEQGEDYPTEPFSTLSKYASMREEFLARPKL